MPTIFPENEWKEKKQEALQAYEKDLEERLVGKTVEIRHGTPGALHQWQNLTIIVSKVRYQNARGYEGVNGPTLYDKDGVGYHTHTEFGVKILEK